MKDKQDINWIEEYFEIINNSKYRDSYNMMDIEIPLLISKDHGHVFKFESNYIVQPHNRIIPNTKYYINEEDAIADLPSELRQDSKSHIWRTQIKRNQICDPITHDLITFNDSETCIKEKWTYDIIHYILQQIKTIENDIKKIHKNKMRSIYLSYKENNIKKEEDYNVGNISHKYKQIDQLITTYYDFISIFDQI